jgi:transaldolase
MSPYVTIMVGRLDDQLRRVAAKDSITIDPGYIEWAGVAAFKKAYKIFQVRKYGGTLLSAAYRNHMHWSQFIGGNVVVSMPYEWWNRFNASTVEVRPRIDQPVRPEIIDELYARFVDFRRAYDEDGMKPEEFVHYGATIHTLNQFVGGYSSLLEVVRARMIR